MEDLVFFTFLFFMLKISRITKVFHVRITKVVVFITTNATKLVLQFSDFLRLSRDFLMRWTNW
jgi:hypothetical protein